MAVKLYNRSYFDDETLRQLLNHAAKAVGCRSGVVVKVTRGGYRSTSCACESSAVRENWLKGKRGCTYGGYFTKRGKWKQVTTRWIKTNGGYVVIRPNQNHDGDFIQAAMGLYKTACHEFGHIRDFQRDEVFDSRKLRWRNRRQERRAMEYADDAMTKLNPEIEDLLLELAIQWERGYYRR